MDLIQANEQSDQDFDNQYGSGSDVDDHDKQQLNLFYVLHHYIFII